MFSSQVITHPDARKIFGKSELEIIRRQLNGIRLTQSEKNRLSRDIRPKFRFIADISHFKKEFDLKFNQNTKKLIQKTKRVILRDKMAKNIKAILLFGSHVNGIVTHRSDIDICVVFSKHISPRDSTLFRIRNSDEFEKKIDIQVFEHLPAKIQSEIIRNHRIIYRKSGVKHIFPAIRHPTMNRIQDRIELIEQYMNELYSIMPSTLDAYTKNIEKKAACERYFGKIIEAVTDLAFLIVKDKKYRIPKDDTNVFEILQSNGIIDEKLYENIKDSRRMRNVLVHMYEKIDDKIVYEAITKKLPQDIKKFIIFVRS